MATPQESTEVDASSAYQAIQDNFSNLLDTSIDPTWLASHLLSSNVITLQQMKDATDDSLKTSTKLYKLLTLVLEGVHRNGHVYNILLNILSKEGEVYECLIKEIESSYERLHSQYVAQSTGVCQPFASNIQYSKPGYKRIQPGMLLYCYVGLFIILACCLLNGGFLLPMNIIKVPPCW